jgi:hypothetical protein
VRDEVPTTRTERVAGERAEDSAAYVYVARRPRAIVGLARVWSVPLSVAQDAVDRLADGLDSCVRAEEQRGTPTAHGAARVVAHLDARGSVGETSVRIGSEPGAATVAILCLVAPMRVMAFPPGDANDRGLAVEALWGTASPIGIP